MGVGFRKGDNALCKKVEDTLKEMKKDGTLAKISKEWFGEDLTIIGEDKQLYISNLVYFKRCQIYKSKDLELGAFFKI